jgi:hypothetical protein
MNRQPVGCGKQRVPHRSRSMRVVNSPPLMPAFGWILGLGTLVSSGSSWLLAKLRNGHRLIGKIAKAFALQFGLW